MGFVTEARGKLNVLSVNNTFRTIPSSQIKTSNSKSKGLSRHQGGFAIDLNGLGTLDKTQLTELNSIAAKYGLHPLANQSEDVPHFSANPTKYGYSDLKAAVDENLNDYDQLTGINTSNISDNKGNIIGVSFNREGSNINDWNNFVNYLINKANAK